MERTKKGGGGGGGGGGVEDYRFTTHNCPVCEDLMATLENERNALVWLLQTCTNKSNQTLGDEINRSLEFENLYIFG